MMADAWPEWLKHITKTPGVAWCGASIPMEWAFMNLEHARTAVEKDERLEPCGHCVLEAMQAQNASENPPTLAEGGCAAEEKCENCRFYLGKPSRFPDGMELNESDFGSCRRMPPTISIRPPIVTEMGSAWKSDTRFPGVPKNSWCGEFSPKGGT